MDFIDISTDKDIDKHIRFDLSRNQTFIISNNDTNETNEISNHQYFPTITLMTSCLFIINTCLAYSKKNYIYAALFLCLAMSSIIYRYAENKYTLFVDRTVIFLVFLYGLYCLYPKINSISKIYLGCIIVSFLTVVTFYLFGKINGCFCFNEDNCIAENYMALVHIFGLIGHNLIINV